MERNAHRLWGVPVAFALHTAEELPAFPAWSARHFGGRMTVRRFAGIHAVLVPLAFYITEHATRDRPGGWWLSAVATMNALFLSNVVFHVVTTVAFGEYSPGLVTATTVVLPINFATRARLARGGLVSPNALAGTTAIGFALNALAVGSLRCGSPTPGRQPLRRIRATWLG
jgi:hypothetical protein